ncbi:unnamed protein product [Effrenium voratum]|uniref:SAP domain-containing protein n=1 Tax=Effrenium voratum TaxID=2562239 RepID=A0AA36MIF4_9DINO|nr:unnamed protein product [Effrenium voratum]
MAMRRGGFLLLALLGGLGFCPSLPTSRRSRVPRAALDDLTAEIVSTLKVAQLREELRGAGLDDSGVKKALVQRLTVAIADRSGEVRKEASKEPEMEPLQPAVRFVVNASVGHMARVVSLPDADHLLVLGDFTGQSSALDAEGHVLWTSSAGLESISNTAVVGSDVFCASGWTGQVSAVAGKAARWTKDVGVGEYARVAATSALAIFGGGSSVHQVAGVDTSSGDVRYCLDPGIGAIWTLCAAGERLLCGGSWTRPEHTAHVAGLDASSGNVLFTANPDVGRYIETALTADGGAAFCGGENGMVTSLDPATGAERWRASSSVQEVWGLAIAADQGLLICDGGWSELMSALDLETGALRWGPVNATVGKIFSFLAVPDLDLVLCGGSDGTLAGLQLASGVLRFVVDVGVGEIWSLAYDARTRQLFCGGNNESVAAVQL